MNMCMLLMWASLGSQLFIYHVGLGLDLDHQVFQQTPLHSELLCLPVT